jgi:hypothetical protein
LGENIKKREKKGGMKCERQGKKEDSNGKLKM